MNNNRTALSIRLIWGILIILFILERVSKILAEKFVPESGVFLVNKSLGFILEYNQGIAFSIPLKGVGLFVIVGVVFASLFWIHIRASKKKETAVIWGTGCMIIGAFSNFLDRVQYESVIDFIRLTKWPTFNVADIFVLCGVSILLLTYFRNQKRYARTITNSGPSRN